MKKGRVVEEPGALTGEEGRRLGEPAVQHEARLPGVLRAANRAHPVGQPWVEHGQPVELGFHQGYLQKRTGVNVCGYKFVVDLSEFPSCLSLTSHGAPVGAAMSRTGSTDKHGFQPGLPAYTCLC